MRRVLRGMGIALLALPLALYILIDLNHYHEAYYGLNAIEFRLFTLGDKDTNGCYRLYDVKGLQDTSKTLLLGMRPLFKTYSLRYEFYPFYNASDGDSGHLDTIKNLAWTFLGQNTPSIDSNMFSPVPKAFHFYTPHYGVESEHLLAVRGCSESIALLHNPDHFLHCYNSKAYSWDIPRGRYNQMLFVVDKKIAASFIRDSIQAEINFTDGRKVLSPLLRH